MSVEALDRTVSTPRPQRPTHFSFQHHSERPLVGLCGLVADPDQEANARPVDSGWWPSCVVCADLLRGLGGEGRR